jgi:macrodomain Ter protein organizer (MatP/YcbG family)
LWRLRGCPVNEARNLRRELEKPPSERTRSLGGSSQRTDFVVTNDLTQDSTEATQQVCGFRWKIVQLHREGKQVTGLEAYPSRKARIQRHHIACAFLVWVRFNALAKQAGQTIYELKHGLLDD